MGRTNSDPGGAAPARARHRSALSDRRFLVYTMANGISSLGLWVQRLAIGWLSWELTHSEIWVGVIAFSLMGPTFFLSPFFGVWIDRLEPLRTATAINVLTALWATMLALFSLAGMLRIEMLFAISVLIGITSAAYAPTRISILPALVPRELLPSAIGISAMIFNGSRLLGPAIAGAVLVALPMAAAFLINAITYAPLIYALAKVRSAPAPKPPKEPFFRQLAEGFAYAGTHPFIRLQLLLTAWGALFGRSILEVLPVYADRLYAASTGGLAILSGAAGAGALVAAFLSSRQRFDSRGLQLGSISLAVVNAAALLVLPVYDNLWLGAFCVMLVGFGSTGSAVLSQTLVQVEVEDRIRGRVSSLWGMASLGGSAFGGLTLGILLRLLDVHHATLVTAVIALVMPAIAWRIVWRRKPEPRRGLESAPLETVAPE
ncbi:MFS transporter [Sphingomonas canadensis]|uniref:MFS transporter n=1 Tax=Sphingomonas canadensis TaxID=1219257 RepID=A0ABW3HC03_9SPHN|nr:MFS transporter [Sphingomonas canadensis]MCW3837627.1 MFS transporter [Sphingomonas canadensis]